MVDRLRQYPRLVGAGIWFVGALWFFRDPVFSGFDTITGDRGDARLAVFLHEHGWRVLQGNASWRSPDMFAPARDTLGYSDTYALDLLVYAPLRLVGFDQFVSFQLTLIALTAVGFAALFTLLRRFLGLALLPTCLLAWTGVFANNVFVDTGHPQIYSINIVSLVVLVFAVAWHVDDVRRRLAVSAGGGLLVGLLLWSTFYFGWYTVFLGVLTIIVVGVVTAFVDGVEVVVATVRARWSMAVATFGGLVIGLVPFFATYLPVLDDSDRRSYAEVAGLAPRPLDLVNVGRHNVAWGWLVEPLLDGDARLDLLNRAIAPTPVLLITAAVATVALLIAVRSSTLVVSRVGAALGVVTVAAVLMPVQFAFGGAWAWVHRFVPGGSALRLFGRIEVVASLLACLTIACWLSARTTDDSVRRPRRVAGPVLVGLLAFICFEQLNTTTGFRQFDRSDELDMLAEAGVAPVGCDVFYVTDAEQQDIDHSLISAILVAHDVDLPTLNGYSGQVPPGWDLRPGTDGYVERVEAWAAERTPSAGICRFELSTSTWSGPL